MLTLVEWVKERFENAARIAETKTGAEQEGWIEDAAYLLACRKVLESQARALQVIRNHGFGLNSPDLEDAVRQVVQGAIAARDNSTELKRRLAESLNSVVADVPQLKRGRMWCTVCGAEQQVDSGECLRSGWPTCCGQTMSIDSPEERAAEKRNESTCWCGLPHKERQSE